MKAIGLYRYLPIDDPESLVDLQIDKPSPTGHDLLVNVKAFSVNPVDVKVRAPKAQTEHPARILGWDAAGIVEAMQLKQLGFETVDYIFCLNSTTKHWKDMAEVIVPQGKICSIVELNGQVDLAALVRKSATFVWEFMFTRSMYQTADIIEQHRLLNAVADLVDAGKIQTTLTRRISPITAANLREAHALVEKGDMIGKVVLEQF
jgi:NADPH:quinone reductase-like Zn-dependent oxidoreductase